jgi:hypothetical protein
MLIAYPSCRREKHAVEDFCDEVLMKKIIPHLTPGSTSETHATTT